MEPPPERQAAGLQPVGVQVPGEWLRDVAPAEARRLSELIADKDLLDRLMWSGYSGPEYEPFAERLARYGYAVVAAWCAKGLIFRHCAAKGLSVRRATISLDD